MKTVLDGCPPLPTTQLLGVDVSTNLKAHLSLTTWLYDIGKHYQCKLRCPSDYSLHSYTHTCTTAVGLSGQSSPAHCQPGRCVGTACRGSQDHLVNLWPSQESIGKLHCQGVIQESSQTLVHSSALVLAAPQAALSRALRGAQVSQLQTPGDLRQLCTCKKFRSVRAPPELGHCRQAARMLCRLLAHTC